METYNLAFLTKKLYQSELKLFTLKSLKDLLEVKKEDALFSVVKRLIKADILTKLEKNKYILKDSQLHDFLLANFLYQPSYVSFESALNFYGILSQFPYELTSATTKKSEKKIIDGKNFNYIHIKKEFFWGYKKMDNFLIATPEKAVFDQAYIASKGLRAAGFDEYDFTLLDNKILSGYFRKYPNLEKFFRDINPLKE